MIDYTNPDTIARQNIAPNAGCNIDGKFYDVRNLVHLASSQADRIEELVNEAVLSKAAYEGVSSLLLSVQQDCIKERQRAERLAEALRLLHDNLVLAFPTVADLGPVANARTTLAEIKGESHD